MSENRGAGRPKLPESEKLISVNLRLTPDQVAWLNSEVERRKFRDRPSRSTVAREIFSHVICAREGANA